MAPPPLVRVVHVVVQSIAGESFEIRVDLPCSVGALKQRIFEQWNVPPVFQKLCMGSAAPGDYADLSEFCRSGDSALCVLLVISLNEAIGDLKISSRRLPALQDLARLGLRGGEDAVAAVMSCCSEDRDWQIRLAAVEALAKVAPRGDERAVTKLLGCLEHRERNVRRAALRALSCVAGRGDAHAVGAVRCCLQDPHGMVRRAAVATMAQVTSKDDRAAIAAVERCREDTDEDVREAAEQALMALAEQSNQRSGMRSQCDTGKEEPSRTVADVAIARACYGC
mmetsp:Transcript_3499/g.8817  ORF Transcript_3499/g.8817 Transcript_3499/m.8817 type:complete len:282 (+) Transcript_3499:43-888(+)